MYAQAFIPTLRVIRKARTSASETPIAAIDVTQVMMMR